MRAVLLLSKALEHVERAICRALIVAFTVLLVVNVTMRYLFASPLFFAEELASLVLVWMASTAILLTIATRSDIAVTIAVDRLPYGARVAVARLVDVLALVIFGVLLVSSVRWIASPLVAYDQVITLGWPKRPFFMIVPVFCAAALVHVLARFAAPVVIDSAPGAVEVE